MDRARIACLALGLCVASAAATAEGQTPPDARPSAAALRLGAGLTSAAGSLARPDGYHMLAAVEVPVPRVSALALRLDGLLAVTESVNNVLVTGNVVYHTPRRLTSLAPYVLGGAGVYLDDGMSPSFAAGAGADFPLRARSGFVELRFHAAGDAFTALSFGMRL